MITKMIANRIMKTIANRIARINFSHGVATSKFLQWAVRACSALLLLSAAAYATPITDIGSNKSDAQDVLPWVRPMDSRLPTASNLSLATGNTVAAIYPSMRFMPSSQPSSDGCVLSSDCSSTIKVPEPQALVLVGSGLLSMAGLVRRRLLR